MLITSWDYDERSQEFKKTSLKELKRLEYGNKEEFLYIKERLYRSQNKSVPMILVRKGLNQGFRRKGNSTGNHTSKSRGECESLTHQGNKEALATVDELIIMFNDEKVKLFIKSVEVEKEIGCYLFMAIVGLIGFMNLANTMIINITTKKQEYGVLQAVGMTNKQLNLSLQIQGLIFTVGTIYVALAAGLPLGYALFSYAKHNGIFGMNVYHVPLIPILVMILLVGILQIVLSYVLSSNLKKETLVERIRYQG